MRKFLVFGFLLIFLSTINQKVVAETAPDSLLLELQKPYHDTIKFELLLSVGDFYEYNQPDIAMDYYNQAKELTEKNLKSPGKYERKFMQQKAKAIRYIAYVYQNQGDLNTALAKYFQALAIGEAISCNLNIYNSYNNIGIINHIQKDYDIAREYYNKAIEITERTGNKVGRAKLYINMGILFFDIGNETDSISKKLQYYQSALENFTIALQIKVDYKDIKGQSLCFENIGNLNKEIAKITDDEKLRLQILLKAKSNYWHSIHLSSSINDKMGLSKAYVNLSELYSMKYALQSIGYANKKNFADSAAFYGEKSFNLAVELNSTYLQNRASLLLKNNFKNTGDIEKALKYADIFIETKDMMFSEEKTKVLKEMMTKYETERKEKEIQLQLVALQKARIRLIQVLSVAGLFIIVISFLAYVLRLKHKTEKELEIKNKQLSESNATKDKFISILAHDLKNPFSAFCNITSSLYQGYDEIDNQDKKYYLSELNQSAQRMSKLLNNMLEWAYLQQSTSAIRLEMLNLYDESQTAVENLESFAKERQLRIENLIPANIEVLVNKSALQSIFNNLITNAIKFSSVNKTITVSVSIKDKFAEVKVEDNGIGITPEDITKLFRIDVDAQTIGNHEGKGTGLGLIICKDLVNRMNGDIFAESIPGKGSKFAFTLPLGKATNA
jgi:signal transduction histidine kinase